LARTTKMSLECRKILNWETLNQDLTVTACDRVLVLCVLWNLKGKLSYLQDRATDLYSGPDKFNPKTLILLPQEAF
jgi:hypothetical protein